MCGFSGYLSRTGHRDLHRSLQAIRHRGPDAMGIWRPDDVPCAMGLGHVRLSILDTSPSANQPFRHRDDLALVFNGEIYNHAELRNRLEALGFHFATHSDTEVILHAWRAWGEQCLAEFDGMFALAIADASRGVTLLARDDPGIKPLYWMQQGEDWLFCSELQGLSVLSGESLRPDKTRFAEFLLNGWLYEPNSGFEGVHKVPPGHAIRISWTDLKATTFPFADRPKARSGRRRLTSLLRETMALQSHADVPVGLFFSGGVDSAVLAMHAGSNLEGFCVAYDGRDDETERAAEVAGHLGFPMESAALCEVSESPQAILDEFRSVAAGTGEPISDFTWLATAQLSQLARARGYKVMLSGMGGDEYFAGYPRYWLVRYRTVLRALSPLLRSATPALRKFRSLSRKADRLVRFASEADFVKAYTQLLGYFSPDEVNTLLQDPKACEPFWQDMQTRLATVGGHSPLRKAMALDKQGFLAHNLTVTDMASMRHAVEIRVPLLAPALSDFSGNCSDNRLIGLSRSKKPLRKVLSRKLPGHLVHQPKAGFNPPLDQRIRNIGRDMITEILADGPVSGILHRPAVLDLVNTHFSNLRDETYKIWQLLYFNFWLEHHAGGVTLP